MNILTLNSALQVRDSCISMRFKWWYTPNHSPALML